MNTIVEKLKTVLTLNILIVCCSCIGEGQRLEVDGKLEPPEPGYFENDKTIGGIDSNNDGVRDDIERWINREFPGEENYNKRMAWKQRAKSIRDVHLNATTKEEAVKYIYKWNDAGVCLMFIYGVLEGEPLRKKWGFSDRLMTKSNDLKERLQRWGYADQSFAGYAYTDPTESKMFYKCGFKLRKKVK